MNICIVDESSVHKIAVFEMSLNETLNSKIPVDELFVDKMYY